jgi:adenylate kinase family enzyme
MTGTGFILDGFPRNRRQAEFLLESYDCDAVILIDVPTRSWSSVSSVAFANVVGWTTT